MLSLILRKAGFDSKVSYFFSDYLVSRKIQFLYNNFISLFFNVDVDVGQKSALSLILFALYISPIFHIFEKKPKNIYFISFIHR